MNSTNLLLSSTGFLLVVALLFSFTKMNQGKNQNSAELVALSREVERLENEKKLFEQQNTSLIFSQPHYSPSFEAPQENSTKNQLEEAQSQLDSLAAENQNLRDQVANANQSNSEVLLPDLEEQPAETAQPEKEDQYSARRARLIKTALLQGTVQAWDPEFWTIAIEPTARANFNLGDELALRRNDGVLCTFNVTSRAGGQFIGDLKSNLATGAPEIVPGDELIIPPVYDRKIE